MPQRIDMTGPNIPFTFEGEPMTACGGDTIAAALIAAGHGTTRSSVVSGEPRGPFCMMGVCFDCLVEVDGVPNRQACMIEVRSGMAVAGQTANEMVA